MSTQNRDTQRDVLAYDACGEDGGDGEDGNAKKGGGGGDGSAGGGGKSIRSHLSPNLA